MAICLLDKDGKGSLYTVIARRTPPKIRSRPYPPTRNVRKEGDCIPPAVINSISSDNSIGSDQFYQQGSISSAGINFISGDQFHQQGSILSAVPIPSVVPISSGYPKDRPRNR